MNDFTPAERVMRARLGGLMLHATHDSNEIAARARAKSPSQLEYFEKQVDPDGVLDPAERARRAERARKAHFTRMSLASARARRRKAGLTADPDGEAA